MADKDWTGNSRSAHAILGARNYAKEERETHDYYATEPKAATLLMELEPLSPLIWECACGEGHLAKEFEKAGHTVYGTDLIARGYGYQQDFLSTVAPPCPVLILLRIRPTLMRLSSWIMQWILSRTDARCVCSSKYNFWKESSVGSYLKSGHQKLFMYQAPVCAAL